MTQENIGRQHFHRREQRKLEKYPHPDKWKRFMDKAILFFAIFGPLMTLPQAFKIWINQNASGVSLIAWSSYLIASIFWLIYGIMHKEKPIIATNIMWIIMNSTVILGTLMYG